MRKIVAGLFVSLDGVVEDPFNWSPPYITDEMWEVIREGITQADAVLLGRCTYQQFAGIWPQQGNDVPMAAFLNNAPKYVVSSSLRTLEWANSSLLKGDLAGALTALKNQEGKNIQVPGSPLLVRSLLLAGLLDELALFILPIVVGAGMRLFDEVPHRIPLRLLQSRTFSSGALAVTYGQADA